MVMCKVPKCLSIHDVMEVDVSDSLLIPIDNVRAQPLGELDKSLQLISVDFPVDLYFPIFLEVHFFSEAFF